MVHHYPALLINCMDPRLQGANAETIARAAGFAPGTFEQLAYPGPSLWAHDPHQPHDADVLRWIIDHVSLPVHGVGTVVIVGHSACGGFSLKGAPHDPAAEKQVIVGSLKQAADGLRQRYPQLRVIGVFVTIHDGDHQGGLPPITCEAIP